MEATRRERSPLGSGSSVACYLLAVTALTACHHDFGFLQGPSSGLDAATDDGDRLSEAGDAKDGSLASSNEDASTEGDNAVPADAGEEADVAPRPTAFRRLVVGAGFVCALNPSGAAVSPSDRVVSCLGTNDYGQLGNGFMGTANDPGSLAWTKVVELAENAKVTPFVGAESLLAGDRFACALRSNQVFCWGDGTESETGVGSTTYAAAPVFLLDFDGAIDQIAGGGRHACVVSEKPVFCWGANGEGQIGADLHESVITFARSVPNIVDTRRLALGSEFSLSLTNEDRVLCWGSDEAHQCPNALDSPCVVEQPFECVGHPVMIEGLQGTKDIAAGALHACATDNLGKVRCWGANDSGQAGVAPPAQCATLAECAVNLTPVDLPGAVNQLALGSDHSCALSNQQVFCWGSGLLLGSNMATKEPVPTPSQVLMEDRSPLDGIVEIAASSTSTCALDSHGNVYCWGSLAGQLLLLAHRIPW